MICVKRLLIFKKKYLLIIWHELVTKFDEQWICYSSLNEWTTTILDVNLSVAGNELIGGALSSRSALLVFLLWSLWVERRRRSIEGKSWDKSSKLCVCRMWIWAVPLWDRPMYPSWLALWRDIRLRGWYRRTRLPWVSHFSFSYFLPRVSYTLFFKVQSQDYDIFLVNTVIYFDN